MTARSPLPGDVRELIERHQQPLRSYVRWLGATADVADEVVQDTFVACLQHRPVAVNGAWLRTVARHLLQRRRRDAGRRATLELDEAAAAWERHLGGDDGESFRTALRACLGQLGGRQGEALRLRYGEELANAAIAAQLGIGAAGVETLLRRLRRALRLCIERRLA